MNINHDEFILIYNVLKEYDDMKEEIKNLRTETVHEIFHRIYKTMLLNCLKCRKKTKSKKPQVLKTKNGNITLLSKCELCDSKKSKFIKEQEASGLLGSL